MPSLNDKIESINDVIEERLNNNNFDEDINIIIGDRSRGNKGRTPFIAVFFEGGNIEHITSNMETWQYNLVIVSLVVDHDPQIGKKRSENLVLEASQALLKGRTLDGTVSDIQRKSFAPGESRVEVGNNTFGAGIEMQARFNFRA